MNHVIHVVHVACWGLFLVGSVGAASAAGVDRVVVFSDRAQVTRTAQTSCSGGSAEAVFADLPIALDTRTLRARASGKATVIGVTDEIVTHGEQVDGRIRALTDEADKLDAELARLEDSIRIEGEQLQSVGGYDAFMRAALAEQVTGARLDTAGWKAALELLEQEYREAGERLVASWAERRSLRRKAELVARRLAHLNPDRSRQARRATVALTCSGSGSSLTVSLSYMVAGASWQPEYDVRFWPANQGKVGKGKVEVTVAAVVQQSSGEDWKNAKITLSTAQPRLGAEAPRLAPLRLTGYEEQKGKVLVQATESRASLKQGKNSGGQSTVQIDDRGQSFVLELPQRVSVLADSRPYWFPVETLSAPATASLVTVPKLAPFVYQMVELNNPAPYPLVAGTAHVYRRGSYIGDVQLDYLASGEAAEISLGIDSDLRVERDDLHEKDKNSGVLSSTAHLERAYRIVVTNRANEELAVQVRENVPVSKVEDVRVELLRKSTTPGFELDEHRGFLSWKVQLKSGKRSITNVAYVIHLPDDWKVR